MKRISTFLRFRRGLCAICLEPMFVHKNKLLKCKHTFHKRCIEIILRIHNKCPICNSNNKLKSPIEILSSLYSNTINEGGDDELATKDTKSKKMDECTLCYCYNNRIKIQPKTPVNILSSSLIHDDDDDNDNGDGGRNGGEIFVRKPHHNYHHQCKSQYVYNYDTANEQQQISPFDSLYKAIIEENRDKVLQHIKDKSINWHKTIRGKTLVEIAQSTGNAVIINIIKNCNKVVNIITNSNDDDDDENHRTMLQPPPPSYNQVIGKDYYKLYPTLN